MVIDTGERIGFFGRLLTGCDGPDGRLFEDELRYQFDQRGWQLDGNVEWKAYPTFVGSIVPDPSCRAPEARDAMTRHLDEYLRLHVNVATSAVDVPAGVETIDE